MRKTLRITAVLCLTYMGASAKGDAPLVYCTGTESGGSGPRQYAYQVDSVSYPMIEFRVGTSDLDPDHYGGVLAPPGWNFTVEPRTMGHVRGLKTPHGEVSPGPCRCLTEGSARWWTDDPALAVEYFVFGYDHPWSSEDVGWDLNTRREGSPPELYSFSESWDAHVGTGMGPIHGPSSPAEECLSNADCELDDYCQLPPETCDAPGTSRPRPHGCPGAWDLVCGCDSVTYANDCAAAAAGVSVAYGSACLAGDFDRDGDADLADFSVLAACMTGPGGGMLLDCDVADLDGDDDVDLGDLHMFHNSSSPRIGKYSASGCLPGTDDLPLDGYSLCGEDQIELTVGPGTLHVLHRNATYNCCVDDIAISLSVEGAVLRLTEEEIVPDPCWCLCCYDVEAAVVDLSPGAYTVEFCWQDWETRGEQCHIEDIVIPEPQPRIEGYSNSGCLSGGGHDQSGGYPPCGDDQIELTVGPSTLHVLHSNATYNCCLDDIVISLSVEGTTLRLQEQEVLTMPCFCLCCYNVEAALVDLAPGIYTVEFCWQDWEAQAEKCHVEEIVIP